MHRCPATVSCAVCSALFLATIHGHSAPWLSLRPQNVRCGSQTKMTGLEDSSKKATACCEMSLRAASVTRTVRVVSSRVTGCHLWCGQNGGQLVGEGRHLVLPRGRSAQAENLGTHLSVAQLTLPLLSWLQAVSPPLPVVLVNVAARTTPLSLSAIHQEIQPRMLGMHLEQCLSEPGALFPA